MIENYKEEQGTGIFIMEYKSLLKLLSTYVWHDLMHVSRQALQEALIQSLQYTSVALSYHFNDFIYL